MLWMAVLSVCASCKEAAPSGAGTAPPQAEEPRAIGSLTPSHLRWDGSESPHGVLELEPYLEWQTSGTERGQAQTAYRVLVASDLAKLRAEEGDLWDSGKVSATDSLGVRYGGPPLAGRQRGVWTVKVWDKQDRPSSFAAPATWEVGPWDEEVEGDWIGRKRAPQETSREPDRSVTYLRKAFTVPSGFKEARLYVSAFGLYQARVNGQRVGQNELTPGFTDPLKRVLLQDYEVTSLLKAGENALGVIVAGGWCTARLGGTQGGCGFEPPRARLALEITLADGTRQALESDESWRAHEGPIVSAALYSGESYDARRELPGWDTPGFDDSAWAPVAEYDHDVEHNVYPDPGPGLHVAEDVPARESVTAGGALVFDLGRSITGWARIALDVPAGTQISLRYARELGPDGGVSAKSTELDSYIAKGSSAEAWEPSFTLHSFRYVEVRGLPARAALRSIVGRAVRSRMPQTLTLETSSPLINRLHADVMAAQEQAFVSVPGTGREPHERPGSLLQAQAVALTACLNRDVRGFYRKFLDDIRDAQHENGAYPQVAPGSAPEGEPSAAAGGVLVPWALYRCYADRSPLDAHTTSMGRWLEHVKAQNPDLVWKNRLRSAPGAPLELGPGTDQALLATAELSYAASVLAQMLRHGGGALSAAAEPYEALADGARSAFQKAFVLPDGRLTSDTQTAYASAIERGMLDGDALLRAGEHLARAVERAGRRPTTGLLGTALLLPALSKVGRDDLAYALLEHFAEPEASHHPSRELAFAGIGEWLYDAVGGIALDARAPAGRHVYVRPRPGAGVTHARASFDSAYGRIETSWVLEGRRFRLKLLMPAGTTATVTLPFAGPVSEGGAPVDKVSGVRLLEVTERGSMLAVDSGSYEFSVERS